MKEKKIVNLNYIFEVMKHFHNFIFDKLTLANNNIIEDKFGLSYSDPIVGIKFRTKYKVYDLTLVDNKYILYIFTGSTVFPKEFSKEAECLRYLEKFVFEY